MRRNDWRLPGICLALLMGPGLVLAEPAVKPGPAPGGTSSRSADSAFFISRSTNRNEVHYGIHVDQDCRPQGPAPVHAYWRMLEKGDKATEPLLGREGPAYGLGDTQQVESTPSGWKVHVRLRAWPDRNIDVDVFRENGRCVARAWTRVEGRAARIDRIFVKTKWPAGVEYVLLSGTDEEGRSAREVIRR